MRKNIVFYDVVFDLFMEFYFFILESIFEGKICFLYFNYIFVELELVVKGIC